MPTYTPTKPVPYIVQDGKYKIEIENAEDKTSQTSGNQYIKLKCRVKMADGSNGPVIYSNLTFTERSFTRTTEALEAMGIAVIYDEPLSIEPEDLIGKEAQALVKLNPETDYMEIKGWVSPKAAKPAPKTSQSAEGDEIPF